VIPLAGTSASAARRCPTLLDGTGLSYPPPAG
jgi:hypothetical protein